MVIAMDLVSGWAWQPKLRNLRQDLIEGMMSPLWRTHYAEGTEFIFSALPNAIDSLAPSMNVHATLCPESIS